MRPVVLFADETSWEAFTALASGLRRRGLLTRRVTAATTGPRSAGLKVLDRLAYGPTWTAACPPDAGDASRAVAAEVVSHLSPDVVDVQATDEISHALIADPAVAGVLRRTSRGFAAEDLFDKGAMDDLARRLGIPVPESVDPASSPQFPVVVKGRRGSGGERVVVAHSPLELEEAVAALSVADEREPLVQAYHGAGLINVGAVADGADLLVAVAYEARPDPGDPTGPSVLVTPVHRDDLVAATASLTAATGYRGMVCVDFVLDERGGAYFIDFNPRAFGGWPALQAPGTDILGAYLHLLGLGPRPEASTAEPGCSRRLMRFPAPVSSGRAVAAWARASLSVVAERHRVLGWRWSTVSLARIAVGAVLGAGSLARGRVSPSRGQRTVRPKA